jgi:hypothetical protein
MHYTKVIYYKSNQTCCTIKHGAFHSEAERETESESERYSRIDSDNARARGGKTAWSLHYTCLLLVALKMSSTRAIHVCYSSHTCLLLVALKMSATRAKHISHPLLLSSKFVVLSDRGQATWTCMPSSASCLSPYNCP